MHKWRPIQQFDGDKNDFERRWWLKIKVSRFAPSQIIIGRRADNDSGWVNTATREMVHPEEFSLKERDPAYDAFINNPPDEGY